MPETTSKLKIPLPLGNEPVSRQARRDELDAIEQNAARDSFILKSAIYNAVTDKITVTFGPGQARFNAGLVDKTTDSAYDIAAPNINTDYYVYLKNDGTFYHNTTGVYIAGYILLRKVSVGAGKSTITTSDMRGEIVEVPGYTPANKIDTDVHASAAAPHSGHETPAGAQAKANAVQTNLTTHSNLTSTAHGATSAATASTLMTRDAAGRAKVAAPSAADDIARKDTVDAHANRTDNPHGTTAAQVGALATSHPSARLSWTGTRISIDSGGNNASCAFADSAGNADTIDGYHASAFWQDLAAPKSFAVNGYQKLPSGLIVQWGTAYANTVVTITYPIAFPNTYYVGFATANHGVNAVAASVEPVSTNPNGQLKITAASPVTVFWLAIGY